MPCFDHFILTKGGPALHETSETHNSDGLPIGQLAQPACTSTHDRGPKSDTYLLLEHSPPSHGQRWLVESFTH